MLEYPLLLPDTSTDVAEVVPSSDEVVVATTPAGKVRLKCNHCDKTFSNKQSKSLHIKVYH